MLPCFCLVTDHRWRQNAVKTTAIASCATFLCNSSRMKLRSIFKIMTLSTNLYSVLASSKRGSWEAVELPSLGSRSSRVAADEDVQDKDSVAKQKGKDHADNRRNARESDLQQGDWSRRGVTNWTRLFIQNRTKLWTRWGVKSQYSPALGRDTGVMLLMSRNFLPRVLSPRKVPSTWSGS